MKRAVFREQRAVVPTLIPEGPQSPGVMGWMRCCLQQRPEICPRCLNVATEELSQRFQKSYAISLEECYGQLCRRQQGENGDMSLSVLSSRQLVM